MPTFRIDIVNEDFSATEECELADADAARQEALRGAVAMGADELCSGKAMLFGAEVSVHDPQADPHDAMADLGVELCAWDALPRADAMVAAVAHREYRELSTEDICRKLVRGGCFVDVKSAYDASALVTAGVHVWRL